MSPPLLLIGSSSTDDDVQDIRGDYQNTVPQQSYAKSKNIAKKQRHIRLITVQFLLARWWCKGG